MKDEKLAEFMGGVTTELKNIYRSLDDMKTEMKANHMDSKETAAALRGILEEYQRCSRQEDLARDLSLKDLGSRTKVIEDAKLDSRVKTVEERQWKIAAMISAVAAGAAFFGSLLRDFVGKLITGILTPKS